MPNEKELLEILKENSAQEIRVIRISGESYKYILGTSNGEDTLPVRAMPQQRRKRDTSPQLYDVFEEGWIVIAEGIQAKDALVEMGNVIKKRRYVNS